MEVVEIPLPSRRRDLRLPPDGATIVTLTVDPAQHSLMDRMELLGRAFLRVAQGRKDRRVLEYDVIGGRVRLVLGGIVEPRPGNAVEAHVHHLRHLRRRPRAA